jgi:ATP-dependent RNA helicase DDX42
LGVLKKYFFTAPEIEMSSEEIKEYRKNLQIRVSFEVESMVPPQPCKTFDDFHFDSTLDQAIVVAEYKEPTPIQQQSIPIALQGYDIIGIAKTGSGKTAAYVWPMLMHIDRQRPIQKNEGAIGIILAPTRELASQIYTETKRFAKGYHYKVASLFGGMKNKK